MKFLEEIRAFKPMCAQEEGDRLAMLQWIEHFPKEILTRESSLMHMTASGFVMNYDRDKVLMVWHNIYRTWSWTGGHADGESDLLRVAAREAMEETGISRVGEICEGIASLDILTVRAHVKRGRYVPPHLHLNATYLLQANEAEPLRVKPDENSDVAWLPADRLREHSNEPDLIVIYEKLIQRAKKYT